MRIAVLFFFFLLFGCTEKPKVPKGIISQNEMRKLMWDLMRADAYVSDFVMKDTSRNQKTESIILYEQIFNMHSTTREAFKKSLAFYEEHPDLLKTITDSLRADERKAQEQQNLTVKARPDSTIRKRPDSTIRKRPDSMLRKMRFTKKPVKQ